MAKALDLFCGAGGASVGLHRAGYEVIGVDINPQPNYPFEFVQSDAMTFPLEGYDLIWASPPCQAYCTLSRKNGHPKLIGPTRKRLQRCGANYIIENVIGAPLIRPVLLCGSMFGLNVRRHRLFETNFLALVPICQHELQHEIRAYYGKRGWLVYTPGSNVQRKDRKPLLRGCVERAPADMGIDWMTWEELCQAIPPAYSQYIASQC